MLILGAVHLRDHNRADVLQSFSELVVLWLKRLAVAAPWGIHLKKRRISTSIGSDFFQFITKQKISTTELIGEHGDNQIKQVPQK